MAVGKVINNILINDSDVQTFFTNNGGGNPRVLPILFQDPAFTDPETVTPSILYEINNTEPTLVKGQTSPVDVFQVSITVLNDSYAQSQELSNLVRSALDNFSGVNSSVNVDNIYFIDEDDNFIQNVHEGQSGIFVVDQLYKIRVKQ
tara:strand:+ start:3465 stop:3905 length:441 start_codon:yes stop_codon:yes gene_type:complete